MGVYLSSTKRGCSCEIIYTFQLEICGEQKSIFLLSYPKSGLFSLSQSYVFHLQVFSLWGSTREEKLGGWRGGVVVGEERRRQIFYLSVAAASVLMLSWELHAQNIYFIYQPTTNFNGSNKTILIEEELECVSRNVLTKGRDKREIKFTRKAGVYSIWEIQSCLGIAVAYLFGVEENHLIFFSSVIHLSFKWDSEVKRASWNSVTYFDICKSASK